MGIHYDYKSTRGMKAMEKQAKREKKLAERKAKRAAKEGFQKKDDFWKYNDFIGFLTQPSNSKNILFKTKDTKIEPGQRVNRGLRCPSGGENRSAAYLRINKLVSYLKPEQDKYVLHKRKRTNRTISQAIISIYDEKDYQQLIDPKKTKSKKNIVLFTETQLCVETEFLLRHLDEIGMNKKRWFFGTLEAKINNISKLVVK